MASYQTIIGLETHIELKTASKMFCPCSADYFGRGPNSHVCPVCLGLPGSLPVPNRQAARMTVLTGLALGCQVAPFSKFDRKNYFYPDLPKGFQISQYDLPLTRNGELPVEAWSGSARKIDNGKLVRIRRVHLEEDTGKLIHATINGRRFSLIDFNRSGVPLMEIVSEPDISSVEEVGLYARRLRQIVLYLGVSGADMEKGQMRFELNISLSPRGKKGLPSYKVEVKNLNSFRFLGKAARYEIRRQLKMLKNGKTPAQETRGWDEIKQATFPQRFKEEAQDYRYFPEPDIPPIRWSKKQLEEIRKGLPELPYKKEERFAKEFKLPASYVQFLTATPARAEFFEEAVKVGKKHGLTPREVANVIVNKRVDLEKLLPAGLVEILVKAQKAPRISRGQLEKVVSEVIDENEKAVRDFTSGKRAAIEFLVGQMARRTKGQADPKEARKLLLEKLKS